MQRASARIGARNASILRGSSHSLHQSHDIANNSMPLIHPAARKEYSCPYTSTLKTYLYEPNASILKAGAFRSVSSIYNVEKLHPNSHLYTSDEYIPDFPGRRFLITGSSSLNKKELKELLGTGKKPTSPYAIFPPA